MADITGTVRVAGVAGAHTVSCYLNSTKSLVATQVAGVVGDYSFTGLVLTTEYIVLFQQAIGEIWLAGTIYTSGDLVRPSVPNGFWYRYNSSGTSHATTEPVWPVILNGTVADNDMIVQNKGFTVQPSAHGPLFPV